MSTDGAASVARIETLVGLGRWTEGQRLAEALLASDPDNIEALANLVLCLHGQDHLYSALAAANRMVALEPGTPRGHHLCSIMLRETGQYPEALRAANAAIQLAPDNWRYHATYANAAAEDKDALWLAHMAAQTALSLAPDEAGAHFLAGLVAHRRNDVTAAKAAYARTLQLEPDHAAAMNNLTILDGLHHTIRASRGLAAALSNEPQSRVLRDNIAALVVRFALTLFMIGGGGVAISLAAASIGGFLARTVAGVSFTTALAWYLTRVVRRVPAGVREYARTRWRHNGRAQLYRSAAVAEIAVVYAAWLAPIPNQIRVGTLAAALVVIICGSAAVAAGRRVRFCPGGYRPLIVVVIQAIAGRQRRR